MSSSDFAKNYVYRGRGYDVDDFLLDEWEGEGDAPPRDVTNVSIHPNVTTIGDCAFSECASLSNIILPSSINSIGHCAFSGCTSLSDITLPSTLTSIGHCAFSGCTSLESIKLPSSITLIDCGAFYGCSSLVSIRLPSSITRIESMVFANCDSLRSVLGPISSNGSCHNFHSLLATTRSCYDLIQLAIKLHPEQLKKVDENGNLPLHVAASSSTLTHWEKTCIIKYLLDACPEAAKIPNNDGNFPLHIRSSNEVNIVADIDFLLAAYPEAAKIPNKDGKFPLFLALESRKEWCNGVEMLLDAFPAITIEADTETNMFPFMAAASIEAGYSLSAIYSLLRTRPEMNTFYHAKAQGENQADSNSHKDEYSLHSSKNQRLE